jgi:hypothetical protein
MPSAMAGRGSLHHVGTAKKPNKHGQNRSVDPLPVSMSGKAADNVIYTFKPLTRRPFLMKLAASRVESRGFSALSNGASVASKGLCSFRSSTWGYPECPAV